MTTSLTTPVAGPGNPDAIGFLREFEGQVDKNWFYKVCHTAITGNVLDDEGMDELLALFSGNASFRGGQASSATATPALAISSGATFLEIMFSSKNFKGMSETLCANFKYSLDKHCQRRR